MDLNTWWLVYIASSFMYEGLFIYFETHSMYGSRALKYKYWLLFFVNTYLTNMYTHFQLHNIFRKSPFKPLLGYTVNYTENFIFYQSTSRIYQAWNHLLMMQIRPKFTESKWLTLKIIRYCFYLTFFTNSLL